MIAARIRDCDVSVSLYGYERKLVLFSCLWNPRQSCRYYLGIYDDNLGRLPSFGKTPS